MRNPKLLNFILSTLSGYVDTAVFVYMGGLFVAHVTGNFVLFGATLGRWFGGSADLGGEHAGIAALQLSSFPLFLVAAATAAAIAGWAERGRAPGKGGGASAGSRVLLAVVTGLFAIVTVAAVVGGRPLDTVLSLTLVVAMGLLNAAHRLDPGMGAPFTVMTGNVTGFAIAIARAAGIAPTPSADPSRPPAPLAATLWGAAAPVVGFLIGCLVGAFAQAHFGLASMAVPTILMVIALAIAV